MEPQALESKSGFLSTSLRSQVICTAWVWSIAECIQWHRHAALPQRPPAPRQPTLPRGYQGGITTVFVSREVL